MVWPTAMLQSPDHWHCSRVAMPSGCNQMPYPLTGLSLRLKTWKQEEKEVPLWSCNWNDYQIDIPCYIYVLVIGGLSEYSMLCWDIAWFLCCSQSRLRVQSVSKRPAWILSEDRVIQWSMKPCSLAVTVHLNHEYTTFELKSSLHPTSDAHWLGLNHNAVALEERPWDWGYPSQCEGVLPTTKSDQYNSC